MALLLCLVLLSALTLLALAGASDQALQQRIQGNSEQRLEAQRAADWALEWAEDWLFSLEGNTGPLPCVADCGRGRVVRPESWLPGAPEQADETWWLEHGFPAGREPASGENLDARMAALPAAWLAGEIAVPDEHLDGLGMELGYYRLIARGASDDGRHVAVVESIVARPWGNSEWTDRLPRLAGQQRLCARHDLAPCGRLSWRRLR